MTRSRWFPLVLAAALAVVLPAAVLAADPPAEESQDPPVAEPVRVEISGVVPWDFGPGWPDLPADVRVVVGGRDAVFGATGPGWSWSVTAIGSPGDVVSVEARYTSGIVESNGRRMAMTAYAVGEGVVAIEGPTVVTMRQGGQVSSLLPPSAEPTMAEAPVRAVLTPPATDLPVPARGSMPGSALVPLLVSVALAATAVLVVTEATRGRR
ncbi:MAG TPA: hypothetical protein VFY23_04545 [Candidatus Limnocylindrales bacterium]|nr:hypothetical protein [Candidatus Limnocylindrales bacterium]